MVDELEALGVDAIKLMYDDMSWVSSRAFPMLSIEIVEAVIDAAHARDLKVFVHAPILGYAKQALAAGADGLLHGIISDRVDDEFIGLMRDSHAYYVSTLSMFYLATGLPAWTDRLEAYDLYNQIPQSIYEQLRSIPDTGAGPLNKREAVALQLPMLNDNLVTLSEAGVPIVIGTDSGIPGMVPGVATHLELALHVEAGLSPQQSIQAATTSAARMLDQDLNGTIAVGMIADLILLEADPLVDIGSTRRLVATIREGRVHRHRHE